MASKPRFVHLHNHSMYSLLDGASHLDRMVARVRKLGMPALALTDHGNLFGVVHFYETCVHQGIKPIIGCELYICDDIARKEKHTARERSYFHLLVLAKNQTGYRNLMKLTSIAHLHGFYYRPRVDHRILEEHSEGLIGATACLNGEIPYAITHSRLTQAREMVEQYARIFGEGGFYLEIMENGIPEQNEVNQALLDLSRQVGLPLLATNDCHYVLPSDSAIQDILLCVQTGKLQSDTDRLRMSTDQFYIKSQEEMEEAFAYCPEAVANTLEVADQCDVELELDKGYHMPEFSVPEGEEDPGDLTEFLRRLAYRGAVERYGEDFSPEVKERIEYELDIIEKTGFVQYYLVVWDVVHYARKVGISVGPGRGSAAGSIVAYCLRITDIEPLGNGLIFERFLNPERVSPPDFDIDFSDKRRDEVVQYVSERFGHDRVTQIGTFGTMGAKGAIRDVARVMGYSPAEADRIAKMIPDGLGVTIRDALRDSPELRDFVESDPRHGQLIKAAGALEGTARHTGVHAAGVVISDQDLTNLVPLMKPQKGEVCTQFDMNAVDRIGLIKMDILGLKTLSVIDDAIANIRRRGENTDWSKLPLDEPKTYRLLCQAKTTGVFQLESRGMRDILKKLRPAKFTDLVPVLGLYRPGPLGSGLVDEFIRRRHNPESVAYDHPLLEPILEETYGIILYQEQVQRIANELAGFSLGQGDLMRRAMGKKKPEIMARISKDFADGAAQKGVPAEVVSKVWRTIEHFASYGFNKSHTVAYAVLSFRTAYLKAHYPKEFMAAVLTNDMGNTDKIAKYTADAKEMGIEVLPPDINESREVFTVTEGGIRFGLGGIKNVGLSAVSSIIRSRDEKGKFSSLKDFCERIDPSHVTARTVECLIRVGAFDSIGRTRASLLAGLGPAMEQAASRIRDQSIGQFNMFEGFSAARQPVDDFADLPELPENERLRDERELLGIYVTGHPLSEHEQDLRLLTNATTATLSEKANLRGLRLAGLVKTIRRRNTRNDDRRMAIFVLEDIEGAVEVVVFPDLYERVMDLLVEDAVVLVEGDGDRREDRVSVRASALLSLEVAKEKYVSAVTIRMLSPGLSDRQIRDLESVLSAHPGSARVFLVLDTPGHREVVVESGPRHRVRPSADLEQPIGELERKIDDLRSYAERESIDLSSEIQPLERRLRDLEKQVYGGLSAWQKVELSRHPDRPYFLDYVQMLMTDFVELHGDRLFRDDPALVTGLATFRGHSVVVIGHQKGRDTEQNVKRLWGMPHPEGFRKAMRMFRLAERFGMPVLCFIDTKGAYPGDQAEERGQSVAIAENLLGMADLHCPMLVAVTGEGGSGGALAVGVGDVLLMQEYAYYAVCTPEACASILWKDAGRKADAAAAMKITSQDLLSLGIIDEIVPEPLGGAHRDPRTAGAMLGDRLEFHLRRLIKCTPETLVANRYTKYRGLGVFREGPTSGIGRNQVQDLRAGG
jgi:DNA polymerase-3 subunit alpha